MKKKVVIINQLNYSELVMEKDRFEKLDTKTLVTVPDQSMTIREIMDRFVVGQEMSIGKYIYYDGSENFDDIDETLDPAFDLADHTAISQEIASNKAKRKAKANGDKRSSEADEPTPKPEPKNKPSLSPPPQVEPLEGEDKSG